MSSPTSLRLVAGAAALFHTRGYAATGVAEVLRAAGAGSGSLYHFFPSKEHLLLAVLDRYRERLREEIFDPVAERVADPIDRIFGVLSFYREFLSASGCALGCPIGNLAGEISDSMPAARARLDELFADWRSGIRTFLSEAAPRLPRGTDLDALAGFVLAVMEGGVMQARAARSVQPFDDAVAHLRAYFDRLAAEAVGRRPKRKRSRRKEQTR